jgi:hypothetical protein
VDTERINYLLNHPKEAIKEDISALEELIQKYPYSQMLHILRAKIGFIFNEENKSKKLTKAAIYSSNRAVLKELIQKENYLENIEEIPVYQDLPIIELDNESNEVADDSHMDVKGDDSASIFDEVLKNLQKLKSLREQFLFLEEDIDTEESKEQISSPSKKPKNTKSSESSKTKKKTPSKQKAKKEKLDKILEKDQEIDTKVNEYFISEIALKEEPSAENKTSKKTVEKEIIEKFIEEQPSIGSIEKELGKSQEEITKDLSEKSTRFGDDLITENLAVIFLKQGKKERAIDIYRKLIWKLPQKKAYFAARIEEINK